MKTRVLGAAGRGRPRAGRMRRSEDRGAGGRRKAPDGMAEYTTFRLTTDLSALSDNDKKMIPFSSRRRRQWTVRFQAYGDKEELLARIDDPAIAPLRPDQLRALGPPGRQRAVRLRGSRGQATMGANFYPRT